ncbi:MaoC family dehydratase [Pelagibacterium lentulum]|uniref:MaoC-like domain-containing protein n=1 Tax=Pelagibacterium lentulum TaxID=2029865 RepID=A0A916VV47_9HYPH|nr:MaoC family dehydratase [Pelagibacterium lentulum]GGA40366.1 hypothetical protein GCM10011499_07390 [Pelagibacterium lentulum]
MTQISHPADTHPLVLPVRIALDENPRYKGSIHDDAVARAQGFRAALVPGAFIYGHFSRLAIMAWGENWAKYGSMGARFRRPVYNGDDLALSRGEFLLRDGVWRADVSAANQEGEVVAVGWIGLPETPQVAPERASIALIERPKERQKLDIGTLVSGLPVLTYERILTQSDFEDSLAAFGEDHPIYSDPGFVHAGCLMRLAMGDTNQSYEYPAPIVLTQAEAQHYAHVYPGQKICFGGTITNVYERNGRHYFDSEEYMIADNKVVARFRRTSIYSD